MKLHRCPFSLSAVSNRFFFVPKNILKMLFRYNSNSLACCLHQPSLWYHSSAVLALALEALTLPYRMRNNSTPMWQVAETLAVSGRKVEPRCHFCYYSGVMVTRAVCVSGGGCLRRGPLPDGSRHVSPRCSECLQRSVALEVPVCLP